MKEKADEKRDGLVLFSKDFLNQLCIVSFLCMAVISNVLTMVGLSGIIKTAIMASLVYLPVGVIFLNRKKEFPYDFFILLSVILLLYGVTYAFYPEYDKSISDEMWKNVVSLYGGVIGYLFIRMQPDPKRLKDALITAAFILFFYYFIQSLGAIGNGYWEMTIDGQVKQKDYSMAFGYNMLLPSTIFACYGLKNKNILYLSLAVVGSIEILMLGSRAAALSLILFLVLYILFVGVRESKKAQKAVIITGFSLAALLFSVFYEKILISLGGFFETLGFSSRTILRLLNGTIAEDSVRNVMWGKTREFIAQSAFTGKGFLSDRFLLGNYCHNIFLELLLDFGVIIGLALCALIVVTCVKMIFKCKSVEWLELF